jgi:hypothetical protein
MLLARKRFAEVTAFVRWRLKRVMWGEG